MAVLEHALLPVRAGSEAAFEAALAEARALIAASPGFIAMTVRRRIRIRRQFRLLQRLGWRQRVGHQIVDPPGWWRAGPWRHWSC